MNMIETIKRGVEQTLACERMSPTMLAIEKAARELASKGPLFADIPNDAPLPGVTHYGRIFDQPAYTAAFIARQLERARKP